MFTDQVISSNKIATIDIASIHQQKEENFVVMKNIGSSIELLLAFAIEGTMAFKMLYKMRTICFELAGDTIANDVSIEALRYLSFIFKYVSTGNIPMAFSAVAPFFLFDVSLAHKHLDIKKEIENFLNVMAEDQSAETRRNMEDVMLNSMKIYSTIR